jgi:hypothetical protein
MTNSDRFYRIVAEVGEGVLYIWALFSPWLLPLVDAVERGAGFYCAIGSAVLITLKLRNARRDRRDG